VAVSRKWGKVQIRGAPRAPRSKVLPESFTRVTHTQFDCRPGQSYFNGGGRRELRAAARNDRRGGGGSGSSGRGEGQEGLEDALCSSGIRSAAAV
jgi:hypothetical protein